MRRIDVENNQMLKRIESLESDVSKKKLSSEWEHSRKYRELISRRSRMQVHDVARQRSKYLERNKYHSFLSPDPSMRLSKKESKGVYTNLTLFGKSSNTSIHLAEERKDGRGPEEVSTLFLEEPFKEDTSRNTSMREINNSATVDVQQHHNRKASFEIPKPQ